MTDLERYERLLRYELACQDAGERLLPFCRFTMPHPRFPHDPAQSRYTTVRAHERMADLLECMERGEVRKAIVTLPPRMGKTQTVHHSGASWMWGRNPEWDIISSTYGGDFAKDHRNHVREILDSQRFRQVFPEFAVRQSGPDELINHLGGHTYFLGRRSPTTGRGANFIIVDDPVKDDKEGRSQVWRDDVWEWFVQTLWSRRHHDRVPVLVTMCMAGDTPVLMADGREKPLREVRPGDRIATYDQGRITATSVRRWSNQGPDLVFRIQMKSGVSVLANARHPFLSECNGRLEWQRTASLRKGSKILRAIGGTTLDEVVSVTAAGVEDVFDIQVDRTANFIANGLVSHNTRWHDDDLVGRITDKSNPKYALKFADGWEVLRLPALAEEDDPIGRRPGEALWPERYGVEALEEMRDANPVAFSALYQGDPAPEDGVFYLAEEISTYDREDLERVRPHLVYYAASDHAVATTQMNDLTCMGVFGVDPTGTAYLMPDLVWRRINAEEAVEQMLRLIKAHKPRWWYAERGHITRAIGPFLKKRMQEEGVYCPIIEDQPVADKTQRAQSARARVAQGKIRFPAYASWWPKAKSEMLRFPNARHDDFVDMLSTIGLKLQSHVTGTFKTPKQAPKEGTWAWQKEQWALEDRSRRRWG